MRHALRLSSALSEHVGHIGLYVNEQLELRCFARIHGGDDILLFSPDEQDKPKSRPGFHVISLKRSKKLQRLHSVLLLANGAKLSSLELARRTNLVALSTWCSHLRANGVALSNEQRTENGQQVWYWWIEPTPTAPSLHKQPEEAA